MSETGAHWRVMTQIDRLTASDTGTGGQFSRLSFVLLLTVSLLFSLMHCAGCEFTFAKADTATTALNLDHGAPPDTPEQQLPCHSGHCLSHVATQQVSAVAAPVDPSLRAYAFSGEQFPAVLAGLPLFKPPRA